MDGSRCLVSLSTLSNYLYRSLRLDIFCTPSGSDLSILLHHNMKGRLELDNTYIYVLLVTHCIQDILLSVMTFSVVTICIGKKISSQNSNKKLNYEIPYLAYSILSNTYICTYTSLIWAEKIILVWWCQIFDECSGTAMYEDTRTIFLSYLNKIKQ